MSNNSKINPWLEVTARIGYAAKGFLYLIMGILAFQIVVGIGGKTVGLKEVVTGSGYRNC
ncbi:MAG: hypothetical protein ABI550_05020 [Ignavibacteriaceae bacterium]